VEGQTGSGSNVTAEIENDLPAGSGGKLHRCRCMCDGKVLWEQLLSARILTIAGSRYECTGSISFIEIKKNNLGICTEPTQLLVLKAECVMMMMRRRRRTMTTTTIVVL
jgi:hypothetical protein